MSNPFDDLFKEIPFPTDYSLVETDGKYRVTVIWDFESADGLLSLVKVFMRHQMPTDGPRY